MRSPWVTGCWNFELLPHLEQTNVFQSTYGPVRYSYSYNYTYNGKSTSYSYSYTYPYSGYQAQRAPKEVLKVFLSPLDYSVNDGDKGAPSSYLANYDPINGYRNLTQIIDGTSTTMFFAEGLALCQQSVTYNYGYIIFKESYGGKRSWNFDPFQYAYTYSYSTSGKNPVTYTTQSYQDPIYAYFSPYGTYNPSNYSYSAFQVRPSPTACDDSAAQALTFGGVLVGMGDASVRVVNPNVSLATWRAAGTSQGGDTLGPDW